MCLLNLVPKPLVELHVKLLRKIGKSVTPDRWEKYLVKVSVGVDFFYIFKLINKTIIIKILY